ncbi:radical SAM/SPASM domain-containing protein [Shewanella sp. Choline-02u-19]|uniref:radical SAM/SPASM domain-containing protein n=2 Tax=unclassified Shewanella TaxID=196818 RepID=UPI000C334ED1|nr:radical SAM protein [Shewanella sp. Choline-02u-19]PKI28147.1 radical SAM/SPASM domain-containing protein [Shewanella sp. Choline-02u-19]
MKFRTYKDLGYSTLFNAKTGFFARVEDKGAPEPFWAPHGPELLDIAITNWCDKGCVFCYRESDKSGTHMSYKDYCYVIDAAEKMGVYQVALGGGNPNQHPEFISFLEYTYSKGIVPNYTTNGRGLTSEVLKASKEFCGAVAVSAYAPYIETEEAIKKLTQMNIKTNIHFLLDASSITKAIEWLKKPPLLLEGINALVFLNYKPTGRKVYEQRLLRNSPLVQEFFALATSNVSKFKVGFDSCCVSGLFARTDANVKTIEACDAGRFSMFISEDMKAYPCSFQKELHEGDVIPENGNFLDIWQNSDNFTGFRDYFASNRCGGCSSKKICLNGCPLFDEIVVCGNR